MRRLFAGIFIVFICSINSALAAPASVCNVKDFTYETFSKIKAGQTESQVSEILKCNTTEKDTRSGANKLNKSWQAGEKHIIVEFLNGKVFKNDEGITEKMGVFLEVGMLAKLPQKTCLVKYFTPGVLTKIKVGMHVSAVAKTIDCSPDKNAQVTGDRISADWSVGNSTSISVLLKNDGTVADDENGEAAIMSQGF
jgi:hypothetical protein